MYNDYTTSTDIAALRTTITLLLEELAQTRAAANEMLARANAAELAKQAAQAQCAALREARWEEAALWTDLGRALLDAARGLREGGDALPLWEALDAIEERQARPSYGRGFLARRR